MHEFFRKLSIRVSNIVGSIWAFLVFISIVLISGFWWRFSANWETNISFLIAVATLSILFFLQRSQNHNDKATHLKLDELIRAVEGARNEVASVENQADADLEKLKDDSI